jgi:parallel beta-helix repeat protein
VSLVRSLLLAAVLLALAPSAASACDLIVTSEDDAKKLSAGQTACVRGTVEGDFWITADRATLTSAPGQQGRIVGEVVIDANASHVTVSDLVIDGSKARWPTPTVYGSHATFARNDVSNGRKDICFQIGPGGSHQRGPVRGTTLADNRIHDCGRSNNHRHGVYVADAIGTRIVGNTIFDNGDRGIQLYPMAKDTLIAGNVLDGNGENVSIGGARGYATSGTRVRHNVLTNPRVRASVESSWEDGSPRGRDNRVEQNCVTGGIDEYAGGFVARANVLEPVAFASRARKDFRLASGSRCAKLVAQGRRAAGLPPAAFSAARR